VYLLEDRETRQIGELVDIDIGWTRVGNGSYSPQLCGIDATGQAECSVEEKLDSVPDAQFKPFGDTPVWGLSTSGGAVAAIREDGEGIVRSRCEWSTRTKGSGGDCVDHYLDDVPFYEDVEELTLHDTFCVRNSQNLVKCESSSTTFGPFLEFETGPSPMSTGLELVVCGFVEEGQLSCSGPLTYPGRETSSPLYPPDGDYVAFDMEGFGACAVTADFELQCWGLGFDSLGELLPCEYVPE
jgi:hypothetical protein